MEFLKMDEITNKFIIMARIATDLRSKGITSSVTLQQDGCSISVHFGEGMDIVELLWSFDATESELLAWWDVLGSEK